MKVKARFGFLWIVVVLFAWPQAGFAQSEICEEFFVGGSYTLQEEQSLDGNLCLMAGVGSLEAGSVVNGDVLFFGGTLHVNGTVTGSVKALGGVVDLEKNSKIGGDIVLIGGEVFGVDQASIDGEIKRNDTAPFSINIPSRVWYSPSAFFRPIWNLVWLPLRSVLWVGLAVLVYFLFPKPVERIGQSAIQQLLAAGGVGLGTALVGLVATVFFAVTIICIPFSLLIGLAFLAAWLVGLIGLGREVGVRMEKLLKQNWSPWVSLSIGVFLLTLIANGFALAIPLFGWLMKILVGLVGLGAVILTRFGSQPYPQFIVPEQAGGDPLAEDIPPSTVA